MGPEMHKVADEILRRLPATFSVLQVGVPYQAQSAPWAGLNGLLGDTSPYSQSVADGADILINGRNSFEGVGPLVGRCPHVALILLGLSQGAQLITTALAQGNAPTPVTGRIKAVLLYGNPVRQPGRTFDVGDNDTKGVLSAPDQQPGGLAPDLPPFLWSAARSYCLPHDPICAFNAADLAIHQDIHSGYATSLYAIDGAVFAANRILGLPRVAIGVDHHDESGQMGWLRYKISVETASVTGLPEQILHLINQTLAESVSQTVDAFKTTVQRDEGWPHSDYPNGFTMEVGIKVRGTWAMAGSVAVVAEVSDFLLATEPSTYTVPIIFGPQGQKLEFADLLLPGGEERLADVAAPLLNRALSGSTGFDPGSGTRVPCATSATALQGRLLQPDDEPLVAAPTEGGVELWFVDYHVDENGGCRTSIVVPWDQLRGILRPDLLPDPGMPLPPVGYAFGAAPDHYIAFGDSYASGEGVSSVVLGVLADDYLDGTHNGDDTCHRSPEAYGSLLGAFGRDFTACSGATSDDMRRGFKTEPTQLDQLDSTVNLVTVSAGGDDVGFADVLDACLDIPFHPRGDSTCLGPPAQGQLTTGIPKALNTMYGRDGSRPLHDKLVDLLHEIHRRSPKARILVMGYPHLFPTHPSNDEVGCGGVHPNWQNALNAATDDMNQVISDAAFDSAVAEFINPVQEFLGHDACQSEQTRWLHDLEASCPGGNGSKQFFICSESFHPKHDGHRAFLRLLFQRIDHDLLEKGTVVTQGKSTILTAGAVPELNVPQNAQT